MTFNKIPLALGFNSSTGNASGLVEFTLDLSNVGGVCDTAPTEGQALVFSGTEWCPSTLPAPGEFTGNLSDVGQVCSAAPTNGQVLTWSGAAGEWCPSTVATGGGGGVASVNGDTGPTVVLDTDDINQGSTNLYNATHTGDVTGNTALTIADGVVNTDQIADDAVTAAKLNANLGDLANVTVGESVNPGIPFVSLGGGFWGVQESAGVISIGSESVSAVSGSYTVSNVVTVPPGTTGKGDSTADSFIFFSGTDASSTEFVGTRWGANWVEGPQNIATTDGNYFAYVSATTAGDTPGASGVAAVALNANALQFIENGSATTATFAALTVNGTAPSSTIAPTLAGHLTTKTYVDSVAGAPKTFLAIGTSTASIANLTVDLTWDTPEISDSDITLASNELTFAVAGTYSIDLSARTTGNNRVELFLRTFKDTGSGHVELTDHTAANYMSRDTDQNTGSVVLSTMFTLAAGDKLKFQCTGNTDGTGTLTTAGTILKILGWT